MTQENRAKQLAHEAMDYYTQFRHTEDDYDFCNNGNDYKTDCELAIHLYQEKKKSCTPKLEFWGIHYGHLECEYEENPEYQFICEVIKYLETLLT